MHVTANGWWALVGLLLLSFVLNPYHYLATGFVIWDLVRNVRRERMWFGLRITRIGKTLLLRYGRAVAVGVVASVALLAVGVRVTISSALYVFAVSIVLGVIRSRLAAAPTAISISVLLSALLRAYHGSVPAAILPVWRAIVEMPQADWLAIAAAAALAEALLSLWGTRDAILPALVTSRRGRRMGAMKLQFGYVVPVAVWITPVARPEFVFVSGWHPWHAPLGQPLEWFAVPLALGWHALLTSLRVERALNHLRWLDIFRGLILAAGFACAYLWRSQAALYAAGASIVVTELFRIVIRRMDRSLEPQFAPDSQGVRVLYVIRGSLAERLGIRPGELITHVNQAPVHTEYDFHFALEQNPAYARFQIADHHGEPRLVSSPVFEGERHNLGLIFVLPGEEPAFRLKRPFGFLETLYLRAPGLMRRDDTSRS
ncbi:PDZ domain-containing protein [Alicyclobacillus mali]|uniref:PDZ domain-containing protein n=1 Tax=Alicyclobacillus mali (ex Roth et al. 2021) TaxID=1123961 RepID=A0ABS0F5J3_9BACL|nr:PDZ domain-containing protein [Alicyclobacillus mali (ex Roth et al. 2021)]MBF8378547.1 PDZ domain-containing protein [Alicyclobacillus mali (ex Roth et al. 2021)]MCL6489588.1 PDZ domain-containing protein [Alicyclobacillus mali (ex Roth et al. 2021)]